MKNFSLIFVILWPSYATNKIENKIPYDMDLLNIENVTKRYSGHTALNDVSLNVPQGSIYGLLGPNGAGKTTLIRVINRITLPDAGRVIFNGHEITDQDIYNIG